MPKKILLIDDDVDIIEMNRALLRVAGYEVEVAYNGQEGLEKVISCKPDLVILDVMMSSVGEGFDVARKIKANPASVTIPILMLSSVNQEHGFKLRIGPDKGWNPVDGFIDKPVRKDMLIRMVDKFLK